MVRRYVAVVLLMLVFGAPLAADVCLVTCASNAGHRHAATASVAGCHENGAARLTAAPHACGHDEEQEPQAIGPSSAANAAATPAVMVDATCLVPPAPVRADVLTRDALASRSPASGLATPLRI